MVHPFSDHPLLPAERAWRGAITFAQHHATLVEIACPRSNTNSTRCGDIAIYCLTFSL
ncbi:hypothetical protein D3C76_707700 [compost metagenome]